MPNVRQLRDTWRNIEPRGQLTIVVSFLLVAVVGYFLWSYASQTSWNAVQTGVNPTDTNRITAALSSAGIPYRVTNGGTEIDVPAGKESAAQAAMASKGVGANGSSQVGLDAVTKTSLGMTDLQQHVLYQEGLQGELEQQIESISGINSAQVTLVLPQDTLFQDQASQASAAVLLTTSGTLDASQVGGIAHMVASGVPGLDPQNVTITDNLGELLWPASGSADGTLTATSKLAAEQNYDSQLAAQINAVIASTLGAGKGTADVNADLNVDQTTQDAVKYSGVKVPLQSQTSKETLTGSGASAGGVAGTSGNVPPTTYPSGGSGNGRSNYLNQTSTQTNGVDKTVTHTIVAPGSVNKLSVALLFDSTVSPAARTAMTNTVKAMIGYSPTRGDMISTASVPFQKSTPASGAPGAGPMGLNIMQIARYAGIGLACLIFLFFVRRNLKKRETAPLFAEPKWLADIQQTVPLAALEAPAPPPTPAISEAEIARREAMHRQMAEIVEQSPDQVAIQVAQWMNEPAS